MPALGIFQGPATLRRPLGGVVHIRVAIRHHEADLSEVRLRKKRPSQRQLAPGGKAADGDRFQLGPHRRQQSNELVQHLERRDVTARASGAAAVAAVCPTDRLMRAVVPPQRGPRPRKRGIPPLLRLGLNCVLAAEPRRDGQRVLRCVEGLRHCHGIAKIIDRIPSRTMEVHHCAGDVFSGRQQRRAAVNRHVPRLPGLAVVT
mmetsp:Transcript_40698/g.122915  ORF Transcript_40698/g.122915 Transcript_40698/m.122915 type:complete len:203 (-) Transcript_40698:188-796(-)